MTFKGNDFHADISAVLEEQGYENTLELLKIIECGIGSDEQYDFYEKLRVAFSSVSSVGLPLRKNSDELVENVKTNLALLHITFTH